MNIPQHFEIQPCQNRSHNFYIQEQCQTRGKYFIDCRWYDHTIKHWCEKFGNFDCKNLINGLVKSRLVCHNAALYGVSETMIDNLQNTAARIISNISRTCHITQVLIQLHWLPVKYIVQYQILVDYVQSPDCSFICICKWHSWSIYTKPNSEISGFTHACNPKCSKV